MIRTRRRNGLGVLQPPEKNVKIKCKKNWIKRKAAYLVKREEVYEETRTNAVNLLRI